MRMHAVAVQAIRESKLASPRLVVAVLTPFYLVCGLARPASTTFRRILRDIHVYLCRKVRTRKLSPSRQLHQTISVANAH